MMRVHKLPMRTVLILCTLVLTSCGVPEKPKDVLEASQMRAIAELAVMECYYNNVAKFKEEDVSGFLFWKKDKHFWIEYNGIVKLGIDVSKLKLEVNNTDVKIYLPAAEILDSEVDPKSLTEDAFIVEDGSAKVTAQDENTAFAVAEQNMLDTAMQDTSLMKSARDRVKTLLEGYVMNLGKHLNIEYKIEWIDLPAESDSIDSLVPPIETP